jgi:ADP-ribose pyrophosphatase YjhB (NUDIX family)
MSADIRIRACLAVVHDDKILLVPHYNTDVGPVQWVIPGGRVAFGESLQEAALREFREETGLQARITGLLDVSEVILPEKSWHSITITFFGSVVGGELAPEADHRYGTKVPRWFSPAELEAVKLSSRRNRGKGMSFDALPASLSVLSVTRWSERTIERLNDTAHLYAEGLSETIRLHPLLG